LERSHRNKALKYLANVWRDFMSMGEKSAVLDRREYPGYRTENRGASLQL